MERKVTLLSVCLEGEEKRAHFPEIETYLNCKEKSRQTLYSTEFIKCHALGTCFEHPTQSI